jgi:hypothetical protein
MRPLTMKEEKRLEIMQRVFQAELTIVGFGSRRAAVLPDQDPGQETGLTSVCSLRSLRNKGCVSLLRSSFYLLD